MARESGSSFEFRGISEITVQYKPTVESRAVAHIYKGDRLLRYGHAYDLDMKQYLPSLTPELTKRGKIRKFQPQIKKRPLEWWKAQCAFRGLGVTGKVGEIQSRLRLAPDAPMIQGLKNLTERARKEFKLKDTEAKLEHWLRQMELIEAADTETRTFLESMFPKLDTALGDDQDKVILVTMGSRHALGKIAGSLGLTVGSFSSRRGLEPTSVEWEIVGKNASAVDRKIMELEREDSERMMELERERQRA